MYIFSGCRTDRESFPTVSFIYKVHHNIYSVQGSGGPWGRREKSTHTWRSSLISPHSSSVTLASTPLALRHSVALRSGPGILCTKKTWSQNRHLKSCSVNQVDQQQVCGPEAGPKISSAQADRDRGEEEREHNNNKTCPDLESAGQAQRPWRILRKNMCE